MSMDPLVVLEELDGATEEEWRAMVVHSCLQLQVPAPRLLVSRPKDGERRWAQWRRTGAALHCAEEAPWLRGLPLLRCLAPASMPSVDLPATAIVDGLRDRQQRARWADLSGLERSAVAMVGEPTEREGLRVLDVELLRVPESEAPPLPMLHQWLERERALWHDGLGLDGEARRGWEPASAADEADAARWPALGMPSCQPASDVDVREGEDAEERLRAESLARTLRCMGFDDEPSLVAAQGAGGNLNVAVDRMLRDGEDWTSR